MFLGIEGLDGSGKGTQVEKLIEALTAMGHKVWKTNQPNSDGYVGKYLRTMLAEGKIFNQSLQAALFLADRIDHITRHGGIKEHLDAGEIVLCDRYYLSSFAYQGQEVGLEWLEDMHFKCPEMIRPDAFIFYDIEPEVAHARIVGRGEKLESYEKDLSLMHKIRDQYLHTIGCLRCSDDVIHIIDAAGEVDDIHLKTMDFVNTLLK